MLHSRSTLSWASAPALALLFCVVFGGGCSSSSSVSIDGAPPDAAPPDAAAPDTVAADAAAPDTVAIDAATPDLAPDTGPKPPPHWEEVSGGPLIPVVESHRAVLLQDGHVLIVGGDTLGVENEQTFKEQTYLYDPSSDSFGEAGKLALPRVFHTATPLDDGRVLVVGGSSADAYEKSSEIYDPKAPAGARWSVGPPMFKHRWDHAAIKLQSGKVLVTGGFYSFDSTSSATLFDPKTNGWVALGGTMTEARRMQEMTLLEDGRVLISGGLIGSGSVWDNEYSRTLELYDPKTKAFSGLTPTMSRARVGHDALRIGSDKVLFFGGYCGDDCSQGEPTHDLYDLALDTVVAVAHPSSYPSTGSAAVLLDDGKVLAVAGQEDRGKAALYDPVSNGWTPLPDMPAPAPSSFSATKLQDGSVLVVGGRTDVQDVVIYSEKAFRFYP